MAKRILMVAVETGSLKGAKVGGEGDVVRDIPLALAELDQEVQVVLPSHGFLAAKSNKPQLMGVVEYRFGGRKERAKLHKLQVEPFHPNLTLYVVDHADLRSFDADGKLEVYHTGDDGRPFATDATRFARFCMATAQAIKDGLFGELDVIHAHDWHSSLLFLLCRCDPAYAGLDAIRKVFTIHNIAYQGQRPFRDDSRYSDPSGLEHWYPGLAYDRAEVVDPRYPDCANPMRIGIRFADAVHVVSPTYAQEICLPSRAPHFFGGEGLENDIIEVRERGQLHGILNGYFYPADPPARRDGFGRLADILKREIAEWERKRSTPFLTAARVRLDEFTRTYWASRPLILTAVSRLVEQKFLIALSPGSRPAKGPGLEQILDFLHSRGGIFILLGTGAEEYQNRMLEISRRHPNFLFLCDYSEAVAHALFANGDLFLMPSSFEPCGIGQMVAMSYGQPCVVHATGGLKDTVRDGETGFHFRGATLSAQVDDFVRTTEEAIKLRRQEPDRWQRMVNAARRAHFSWEASARQYLARLY